IGFACLSTRPARGAPQGPETPGSGQRTTTRGGSLVKSAWTRLLRPGNSTIWVDTGPSQVALRKVTWWRRAGRLSPVTGVVDCAPAPVALGRGRPGNG